MRIVHVIGRNGVAYEVPMTGEQAAFFLRMAEFKATSDPEITFHEVVADWRQKQSRASRSHSSGREERSV